MVADSSAVPQRLTADIETACSRLDKGTGRQLVTQSLSQGHEVTAYARHPAKLEIEQAKLTVVQGDVEDPASVERAVPGHEAVVCAIGAPAWARNPIRTEGTRRLIAAMEKAGVRRLICQSTLGVGDSSNVPLPFHLKHIVIPLVLRRAFADHEGQERLVMRSRLEWTIVRPASMTNGKRTGAYPHGFSATDTGVKVKISRADVADFMLRQLSDDTYLRKAPLLVLLTRCVSPSPTEHWATTASSRRSLST